MVICSLGNHKEGLHGFAAGSVHISGVESCLEPMPYSGWSFDHIGIVAGLSDDVGVFEIEQKTTC